MSRNRYFKSDMFSDPKVRKLSVHARTVFISAILKSDCAGIVEWTPEFIKMATFPSDDLSISQVQAFMDELESLEMIKPYAERDGGLPYGLIVNFHRHQVTKNPSISKSPMPPDGYPHEYILKLNDTQRDTLFRWNGKVSRCVWGGNIKNLKSINLKESINGKSPCYGEAQPVENSGSVEKQGRNEKNGFHSFWKLYPKKVRPVVTQGIWDELSLSPLQAATLMVELKKQIETGKLSADNRHTPRPEVWLKNRMWEK